MWHCNLIEFHIDLDHLSWFQLCILSDPLVWQVFFESRVSTLKKMWFPCHKIWLSRCSIGAQMGNDKWLGTTPEKTQNNPPSSNFRVFGAWYRPRRFGPLQPKTDDGLCLKSLCHYSPRLPSQVTSDWSFFPKPQLFWEGYNHSWILGRQMNPKGTIIFCDQSPSFLRSPFNAHTQSQISVQS